MYPEATITITLQNKGANLFDARRFAQNLMLYAEETDFFLGYIEENCDEEEKLNLAHPIIYTIE